MYPFIHLLSVRLSILSTPYRPAQHAVTPLTRYAAVLLVAVWKQHKLRRDKRFWKAVNPRDDDVTLLDMRNVAWSESDKNYVICRRRPTYLAKMIHKSYVQFPTYVKLHSWNTLKPRNC